MNVALHVHCPACDKPITMNARKIVWRNEWWGVCCGIEFVVQATIINPDAPRRVMTKK